MGERMRENERWGEGGAVGKEGREGGGVRKESEKEREREKNHISFIKFGFKKS